MAVAGLAAGLLVPGAAQSAPRAAKSVTTIRVLQWNMAGSARNNGETTDVVNAAAKAVRENDADIVTLNEACHKQADAVQQRLHDIDPAWHGHFATGNVYPGNCKSGSGGGQFGNAVISRLPVSDPTQYWLRAKSADPLTGRQVWEPTDEVSTKRVLACLTVTAGQAVRVCATHLESKNNPFGRATPVQQAHGIADWAKERKRPILLTGDFNAEPTDRPKLNDGSRVPSIQDHLYAESQGGDGPFYEAGYNGADDLGDPTHSEGKLDFILSEKGAFGQPRDSETVLGAGRCANAPDGLCSDHRMVLAELATIPAA